MDRGKVWSWIVKYDYKNTKKLGKENNDSVTIGSFIIKQKNLRKRGIIPKIVLGNPVNA